VKSGAMRVGKAVGAAIVLSWACACGSVQGSAGAVAADSDSTATFDSLMARACVARWDTLAPGARIDRFATALLGTPYVEGTLEGPGDEVCRLTARGFDCVTLIETCLNLARVTGVWRHGGPTPTVGDLRDAVTFTRYRGGRLDGYTSRLHYTSDWIADNVARGVFHDVTREIGGEPFDVRLAFMSEHPDLYPALRGHPARIDTMRTIEQRVSRVPRFFVPKARVAEIEPMLRTGDLIAITTSVKGLDYSHTGLIHVDPGGAARFLHASSAQGKVVLDTTIAGYLARGPKSNTGITVLRP
jgi:N-acetylmuramoyl-L-alanine amidase-like